MISYLSHKYPDKPHDQIVAIGASECGVSRKNDIGLDAGIRAALHLAHYKEKYPTLSLHENLAKAYHKVMMVDDMVLDMLENGQEQPLDAIFLELAHDFEDTISVRETKNYIRKRQFEPSECKAGTYRTFTLASGKKAVGCKVNGKFKVQSILEKKKKDLTFDVRPLEECTSRGYTEEECFKFFNASKQKGIKGKITYTGEGSKSLNEEGRSTLNEMIKELSLLPKELRSGFKITIYKTFDDDLPADMRKDTRWLGFWNQSRNEMGFSADNLNSVSKAYARSSMLHEIGHRIHHTLSRWGKDYVHDQYLKFKNKLELSPRFVDKYASKNVSEYFAEMFARANESKKGEGSGLYAEPHFIEYLREFKRQEDFTLDISKENVIYVRKQYKGKIYFGYKVITGKLDLTEDAAPKTASYRAPRAGTPAAMAGGARRTTVGQALKEQGVPLTVSGPESITLPFKILNTETGELVEGEVIENLEQGTVQMQPVSSSNVRSVGQAQNELVVAFHSSGEGRFYRFKFSNQEMASEARNALLDSSSPGRWIWHNIRGHQAGEAVTPSKIGPAITSGKPTIGGTSASLVNYRITPVGPSRVKGYKEAYEKLQRQTSNPSTDPSTGARIEGLLGARKGFRELGRKIRQDHACDFTMEGMLTRSGEFDYRAEGQGIKIKTPENLKWIAENTDHVPVFGKRERGSHQESEYSLIGFAHQFTYIPVGEVDDYAHIYGKTELFKDIKDLSDLENPRELPVSFGFDDIGEGGVQKIIRLHHLAVSLNKIERDRCSTMNGPSCTISPISQVDMRQKLEIKPLKTVVVSLKK